MKLIADSGSTKTSWHLFDDSGIVETDCKTSGINPFFQHSSEIVKTLKDEFTLSVSGISSVYFYGAGAANETKKKELHTALHDYFGINTIHIASDLLAAAHSLCGQEPGIAAILGTGSNSCYYDGEKIAHNVSPLGYVLGDEGSGAVLGRKLLADVLKNQLPQSLIKLFFETYPLTPAEIIENIYRKPFPNRFMANFTKFLSSNIKEPFLHELVLKSFKQFFIRNISQYDRASALPVHFTGSIAWNFRDILSEAAQATGFSIGTISCNPMDGLIKYHEMISK
jgi:glucosamine kinase